MLPFLFPALCFSLLLPSSSLSFCHPDEAIALLHFKNSFSINSSTPHSSSINGSASDCHNFHYYLFAGLYTPITPRNAYVKSYHKTKSWKEGTDCCKWDGVSCDNVSGHIIGLDLFCSQLQGSFPPNSTLFNLPHLQSLNLGFNDFRNSKIPVELGGLTALKHLNLYHSDFSGHVPSTISHLSNLEYLDLSYMQLEMERDVFGALVQNLSQIRHIFIDDINMSSIKVGLLANLSSTLISFIAPSCHLKGSLPEDIFNLPHLKRIELSDNNELTGNLPDSIGQSKSLNYFNIDGCSLSGSIPNSLGNLSQLTRLHLGMNKFSGGQFPHFLTNLTQLDTLSLSACQLSGSIPDHEVTYPNLMLLDLSFNNLTGNIPMWLHNLSQITFLVLSDNLLTGYIPNFLSTKLLQIQLSGNKLQGLIPYSICQSAYLEIVDLSHNMINGTIPQCLFNSSSSLSVLNLGRNKLRGKIPSMLPKGCRLEYLDLNENQLEGALPESIAHCKGLTVLNLGANHLTGSIPGWVETLPELQVIILRSNNFHGSLRTSSRHKHPFYKLRILDLSNNKFSGHIPEGYMKNLKSMVYLDYNLTGSSMYMQHTNIAADESYGFSVSLTIKGSEMELEKILTVFTSIDLSHNKFSGEIPHDLGMLEALKGLNLSHNKLSGRIPQSFGNITNLEWLDLSSNKLTGQIPVELAKYLTFLSKMNLSSNHLTGHIPVGKQFDTFSNDSYAGNEGLCDIPLSKSCPNSNKEMHPAAVLPQPASDLVHQSMIEWKAVLLGIPCGVSIGISMACFIFRNGDPKWFQKLFQLICMRRRGTS